MAHRLVPIQLAKTAVDAEAHVIDDTGGQIIPIVGKTTKVKDGWEFWRVEVYSMDGRAAAPMLAGKEQFTVIAVSVCGKFVRVRDSFGIENDIPRAFDSDVALEMGDVLSARYASPTEIVDIFPERRANGSSFWEERPQVESAGNDGPGWELGKATGPGFRKQ